MAGIKELQAEMGIKPTRKGRSCQIEVLVYLEVEVAKSLIRLADLQNMSVGQCVRNLINMALEGK